MPKNVDSPIHRKAQIRDALRDTGQLIAAARKERGWSQTNLGQRLGDVDRRHVSAMEKGDPNVGVGLVVAALWLLDLPLLATLPDSPSGGLFLADPGLLRARRTSTRKRTRPTEIDNDF